MKKVLFLAILFLVQSSLVFAQPSQGVLDQISQRGILLSEYDQAAWIATDAIMSSNPDKDLIQGYVAQKFGDEWDVIFGAMTEEKDAFVVHYKYSQNLERSKKQRIPYLDKGFYYQAAVAIDKAFEDFNKINQYNRPFNTTVIPQGDNFYVYIYPAPIKQNIYPLGGDWRYLVSGETFKILEKRQLHKSIIEPKVPLKESMVSGYHIAILDDIPEETDVLHVLTRKPSIPEIIATQKYVYEIKIDGSIKYLGTVENVLGKKE